MSSTTFAFKKYFFSPVFFCNITKWITTHWHASCYPPALTVLVTLIWLAACKSVALCWTVRSPRSRCWSPQRCSSVLWVQPEFCECRDCFLRPISTRCLLNGFFFLPPLKKKVEFSVLIWTTIRFYQQFCQHFECNKLLHNENHYGPLCPCCLCLLQTILPVSVSWHHPLTALSES